MSKVGIIGTGWIAHVHAKALTKLGIPIAAVVGHDEEKARAFAEKWKISRFGTDMQLLYDPHIDCVHLCTPPAAHYEQIVWLLSHDKHIFCEKPLCIDACEAQTIATLAEEKELICAVGFNVRFYRACQKARELVQNPDFGRVLLVHGSYLQEFGAEPAQWSWRYEDEMHAVTEIGSHWLDLAQYISGKRITAVSALFDRFHPLRYKKEGFLYNKKLPESKAMEVRSEDAAAISLRFEDGAMGAVVLSELSHGRGNRLSLEVTGEKQSLWWNSEDSGRLFVASKGSRPVEFTFEDGFEDTFDSLINSFYRAVREGGHCGCPDFAEGRDNVLLCSAIGRSAKGNSRWVEV